MYYITKNGRRDFYYEASKKETLHVGHIEVKCDLHKKFEKNYEKFLDEATKLFDIIVLGNKELKNEYVKK